MATRLQLRDRARVYADQDNSTFPTDAQYNTFLDESAADVWRRLIGAGWLPDRTTVNISASGAASYTLGTDVHSVLEVYRIDNQNVRCPLRRIKPEEVVPYQTFTGLAELYQLVGGATSALTIEFYPRPSSGSYEVRYIKRFPGFSGDADNWYGPDGTDKLIVYGAAIAGASKENAMEKVSTLQKLQGAYWTEVLEQANWLDQKSVPTIRDTRFPFRRDGADYLEREGWYE